MDKKITETLFQTTEYDKFHFIIGNRPIKPSHVERLAKRMLKEGFLKDRAIDVNPDMGIAEGQHRLLGAKLAGIPFWYKVLEQPATIASIQGRNVMLPWNTVDFVSSYIARGDTRYITLKAFADDDILYKGKLRQGLMPTDSERDETCHRQIMRVQALRRQFSSILVNQAFVKDRQRWLFLEAFPDTEFVLLTTPPQTITERLTANPRNGHALSTNLALHVGTIFESPTVPHTTITNTGDLATLRQQLIATIM